jgi:hypothetical protein
MVPAPELEPFEAIAPLPEVITHLTQGCGLNPGPSLEGGLEELRELGQLARQGRKLTAELVVLLPENLNLLRLSQDQCSYAGWCCQPIRFWNPGRRGAHHRRSLPEKQPEIKLPLCARSHHLVVADSAAFYPLHCCHWYLLTKTSA